MSAFSVVIPARYASTRLPGKPLLDLGGKPMVVRVAEQARLSGANEIVIATDHDEIAEAVQRHGYTSVMTRADHACGTDRIAEVVAVHGFAPEHIVVNVQGDEPLIEPDVIGCVAKQLADHRDASIASACSALTDAADFGNPNVVKVVLDRDGYALYFSRAPIPYPRDDFIRAAHDPSWITAPSSSSGGLPSGLPAYRHIGIYAYRCEFLKSYTQLAAAPIEQFEALEQLRALWHGHRITMAIVPAATHAGVDTAADLERVRAIFTGN